MDLKFVFLICLIPAASAKFQVEAKDKELVVAVGSDVELPCTLSPPSSAVGLEVRWFHTVFHSVVYLLKDGREDRQQQNTEYRERAFLKSGPQTGNLALSLLKVRLSDAGTYHCFVENETAAYDEEDFVKLVVIGPGSPPLVKVSLQDSSVQISCSSSDWFPEPTVNWKTDDEAFVNEEMTTSHKQTDGLFSVTNNILLKDSSEGNLFCTMKHPVTGKESGVYVIVSESMFPRLSHWAILFFVLLVLSLGAFAFVGWKFYAYCIEKEKQLSSKENILKFSLKQSFSLFFQLFRSKNLNPFILIHIQPFVGWLFLQTNTLFRQLNRNKMSPQVKTGLTLSRVFLLSLPLIQGSTTGKLKSKKEVESSGQLALQNRQ
ncbi:uncharacterized protein LOC100144947 isoform X3 [Xenopus tropicalis]|uniref:Uncharacterized protein LOC100144947 isoform X3 n=1 Tax=Xenopus tropicalis TaxID=8364 RepID=A0A8J1IMU4_XENTR|nr:uncharacterized protein LOC100144947 isoform X3 [Xenopus tropicalis]